MEGKSRTEEEKDEEERKERRAKCEFDVREVDSREEVPGVHASSLNEKVTIKDDAVFSCFPSNFLQLREGMVSERTWKENSHVR